MIENARLQLALIIPTSDPIEAVNNGIEMLSVATNKRINYFSKYLKEAIYVLRFLLISSLSLISAIK